MNGESWKCALLKIMMRTKHQNLRTWLIQASSAVMICQFLYFVITWPATRHLVFHGLPWFYQVRSKQDHPEFNQVALARVARSVRPAVPMAAVEPESVFLHLRDATRRHRSILPEAFAEEKIWKSHSMPLLAAVLRVSAACTQLCRKPRACLCDEWMPDEM